MDKGKGIGGQRNCFLVYMTLIMLHIWLKQIQCTIFQTITKGSLGHLLIMRFRLLLSACYFLLLGMLNGKGYVGTSLNLKFGIMGWDCVDYL